MESNPAGVLIGMPKWVLGSYEVEIKGVKVFAFHAVFPGWEELVQF